MVFLLFPYCFFVYFTMGFRVLFSLTMKDLFKLYMGLEPVESQFFSAIIAFPWSMKFFLGIFVDNFKFWGSTRNFYLKIAGIVMWLWLILIQLDIFQSKYWILIFLIIFNLFSALSGVVTDAIMVIYARKDPEYGSSDLQTLHIIAFSFGGILGSIIASYANENFHPYYIFSFYSCISLLYTLLAFLIEDITVDDNVNVWDNIIVSLNHLRSKIVLGTIIFLIISRGTIHYKTKIDFLNLNYLIF